MNHGRSCYLTWMRGAIWRAATSLASPPEAAVGRRKYRSRLLLGMPSFASNLAGPARKVKHTLACADPPSVSSRPRVRFRSTETSALVGSGRRRPAAIGAVRASRWAHEKSRSGTRRSIAPKCYGTDLAQAACKAQDRCVESDRRSWCYPSFVASVVDKLLASR
jgi:hypothetical protein